MYQYDELDQAFVDERVAEFRDQTRRHLAGELSEEEFRPLRLRNGLYIQRHAPMLRIAHSLWTAQRAAAAQARRHRAPLRPRLRAFHDAPEPAANWPKLEDVPDILAELASVQMHAIQTSGNCIRNVTADHFAGIAPDEIDDPRPYCEIIRQWATLHPEFTYLPRKFKIAVTGSPTDRAASEVHDVGLHLVRDASGCLGFRGAGRRRPRAHADDRPGDPRVPAARAAARVSGGHPARLQPPGPPRQHPQGAHQDPGQGARHRALPRAGRGGVAGQPRARAAAAARGNRARAPLLQAAALRDSR